ncbi:MAG: formyltetrahydrofolate deformylase [Alphaproteobacteria bacterium]|nr:formyltetrahydrofolate deformylase [Alphaproteobacteria bacterium]
MSDTVLKYVLCLQCPDKPGIVATVSTYLSNADCNIEASSQFNDPFSGQFFMRVEYSSANKSGHDVFIKNFQNIAESFSMIWHIYDWGTPVRTLLMVSNHDHCLHDILYRWSAGNLPIEITGVVSNHETSRKLVEAHDLPYHYLPVTKSNKTKQEEQLSKIIEETDTDLVVLARYMQVLSADFCEKYRGRVINIHHSFLPGFKGAKPYHQAYERGVKLIGATAHFATEDLDEGPIIEQDTVRISHADDPEKLRILGQDTERRVLARALNLYARHHVFLQGHRTVIL